MIRILTYIFVCICIFSCKKQIKRELIPYRDDLGKWGYIDEHSKQIVIPCIYERVYPFVDGLAVVKSSEHLRETIIDTLNNYVLPPEEFGMNFDYSDKNRKYAIFGKYSKVGLYDLDKREVVISDEYDGLQMYPTNYIRLKKDGKYGYAKKDGTLITPIKYDYAWDGDFKGSYAIVSVDGLEGIINSTGVEIVPCKYKNIMSVDGKSGSFVVYESQNIIIRNGRKEGGIKIINKEGKTVFHDEPRGLYTTQCFSDGLMVFAGRNGKQGFIDSQGKLKIPYMYDETFGFEHGLAVVTNFGREDKGTQSAVIDTDNNIIIPFGNYSFRIDSDSLLIVLNNNGFGLCDRNQKELIPTQYDKIERISDYLFKVKKDDLYGIFDTKGKQLQPCKYYSIEEFSEGMAEVYQDGMGSGYINEEGIEAIECKYKIASPFHNGLASFQVWNGVGLVDKKGREYWIYHENEK